MSKTHVYSQQSISRSIEYRLFLILFLQNCLIIVNFVAFKLYSLYFSNLFHFNCIYIKKIKWHEQSNCIWSLLFNNFHGGVSMRRRRFMFSLSTCFFCICFNTHEKIPYHFQCIYFFKSILIYYSDLSEN